MKMSNEAYIESLKARLEARTLTVERCLKGADDLKMAYRNNQTVAGMRGKCLVILADEIERMVRDLMAYEAPTPAGHLDLRAWADDPEMDRDYEESVYGKGPKQGTQLLAR